MKNILEIDGVQLSFGERKILNNIYINSETGKVTGIIGRNGSGKSSLLKLIFGELHAAEKSVRINKEKLFDNSRDCKDIIMLPQFNFIPKYIKIRQAFKNFDLDYSEFLNLFEEFNKYSDFKIKKLSGGDIRIIEIFLILKSNSRFCILDEPFSHLSPKNIDIFKQIIKQEKERKGIIITDHLYNYVTELSDELYIIKDCSSYKIDDIDKLKQYGYLQK